MKVSALYRHPVKSHGREALETVTLHTGQSMPFDRLWAVAHDASKADGSEWAPCANFSRGSKAPELMAIFATLAEATGLLTLTHPKRPDLVVNPDEEPEKLIAWTQAIVPQDRALPARLVRLDQRGFTDTPYASISLCSTASHEAVSAQAGGDLSPHRWRGNIWFDGAEPWAEREWIGQRISIGDAILSVRENAVRCLATTANPATGARDVDTLALLNGNWGHQDFGLYTEVVQDGQIAVGDPVEVL